MLEEKEIRCEGCGKMIPKNEVLNVQMKTCCSTENVPLCKSCWEKYYGLKREKKI